MITDVANAVQPEATLHDQFNQTNKVSGDGGRERRKLFEGSLL